MSNWKKHVLPHGPIRELSPGLWQVSGTLEKNPLPRNMVIYRLPDGGLWIHSAVALDETSMKQLESFGTPQVMVVPSPIHRIDAGVYKERYPLLQVYCPEAATDKVRQVVKVDGSCEKALPAHGIKSILMPGIKPTELCYRLPLESGGHALIFNDAIMNVPHSKGFQGFILKLLGSTGFFGITRIGKMVLLKDKKSFASWLKSMSQEKDLRMILMSHGDAVTQNPTQALSNAAERV